MHITYTKYKNTVVFILLLAFWLLPRCSVYSRQLVFVGFSKPNFNQVLLGILFVIIIGLLVLLYSKNKIINRQIGDITKNEARFKYIYETIGVGILSAHLDGKIIMANPKMISMLGYSSLEELQQINLNQIYLNPETRTKLIDEMSANGLSEISSEVFWKKKNGEPILLRFTGKHHVNKEGVTYLESVFFDVTEMRRLEQSLKESEADLRRSNAAKDRFFSVLAHDLRGPFNSLLGFTEILANHPETVDEEDKKRFISLMHSSVQNLSNLVENLLQWSRSQLGSIDFSPHKINLKLLVSESASLFSEAIFSKQINILCDIDPTIELMVDENMTKVIFRNLINNAIKFTHAQGNIEIYTAQIVEVNGRQQIEIAIQDNGVGIEENDIVKLFKIDSGFTHLGTNNEKGSGFGLVLIKEFIDLHAGTIRVESELGIGTKVIFTLPIASSDEKN